MPVKYQYPEPIIEEIIAKNDIVETISGYVKLDRKGKDYFGLCPFHKEKTPSFSVVPAKQIYYCFGCNKGGNVINFIKDIENLEYGEAVRLLADKAGITIPEKNSYVDEASLRKEKRTYEMNSIAANFYYDCIKSDSEHIALDYLKERKVEAKTITNFGVGYAPDAWSKLTDHFKKNGFTENEIIEAGLASKSKGGVIDKFRNRVMFPIIDTRSRVIGFGGRALKDDEVKYMNSPETCVYKKNKSLFGINIAKNTAEHFSIIVEGYMDCITLHQAGFTNTIASLGTALTDSQAKMIKRMFGQVIIAYDNDAAGQNASLRGLDILANMGCVVKVLVIPSVDRHGEKIKDPDDYIKKMGKDEFKLILKTAMMLVEYKALLLTLSCDLNTSEGQIAFLKGVASAIGQVQSPIEREVYIKNISARFGTNYDALLKEVQNRTGEKIDSGLKESRVSNKESISAVLRDKDTESTLNKMYYTIIVLLCNNPSFTDKIRHELLDADILHSNYCKELLAEILTKYESLEYPDESKISAMLDDEQRALFVKEAAGYHTISDPVKALSDYIQKYRQEIIINNNKVLSQALASEGISEDEKKQLIEELRNNTALLAKYKMNK